MNIKIISDGTATGTKIVDTTTGEQLNGVTKLTYTIESGGLAKAILELEPISAEIVGYIGTDCECTYPLLVSGICCKCGKKRMEMLK
jgi:hypothetical protein